MNDIEEMMLLIQAELVLQNVDKLSKEDIKEGLEALEMDMKGLKEGEELPDTIYRLHKALKNRDEILRDSSASL